MSSISVSAGKRFIIRFIIAGFLGGASLSMAVCLLASSAWLISMASTQPPVLTLQVAVVGVRFFGLSRGIFRYAERIYGHDAILRAASALQLSLYAALVHREPMSTSSMRQGKLLQQLTADIELVQDRWIRIFIPGLSAAISAWAGIGIVHWLNPNISLLFITIYLVTVAATFFFSGSFSRRHSAEVFETESQIADLVSDTVRGHLEARMYGYENRIGSDLAQGEKRIIECEKKIINSAGISNALLLLGLYSTLILGFIKAAQSFIAGELSGVNIAVISLLPLAIFDGIGALIAPLSQFGKIERATSNIDSIIVTEDKIDGAASLESGSAMIKSVAARGMWSGEPVIHSPLTFTLRGGEILLLQGESGIGKSSFALALSGLILYQGSIRINGIEVRDINRSDLVAAITLSLQDDHLFSTSIRENLKIANPDADDLTIKNILDVVELSDLIESLPEGLDTHIGAFGKNFSGGELQRMRLARVLLRKSPIYLLDEPLEHLERVQALRIFDAIRQQLSGATIIVISHEEIPDISNSLSLKPDSDQALRAN